LLPGAPAGSMTLMLPMTNGIAESVRSAGIRAPVDIAAERTDTGVRDPLGRWVLRLPKGGSFAQ